MKEKQIKELLKEYLYRKKSKGDEDFMNNNDILLDFIKKKPSTRTTLYKYLVETSITIEQQNLDDIDKTLMSHATFHKHLKNLRDIGKILLDKTTKKYSFNQYYKEYSKDTEQQIWFNKSVLDKRREHLEENEIYELEVKLRSKMIRNIEIIHNFGEKLKNKFIIGEIANTLYFEVIYNFMREIYLMNPDIWHIIEKPEDLDFRITIKCNFHNLFSVFNKLKDFYKELGILRQFPLHDPELLRPKFLTITHENKYKMKNKIPLDKSDEEFYKDAVYYDFKAREIFEKMKNF